MPGRKPAHQGACAGDFKQKSAKEKIKSELARINEIARKNGMTYGQLVAKTKCDEERAKRLAQKEIKNG